MFKLVKFAFVVGALAAVWTLVPVAGRTLHARWSAASDPKAFAQGLWTDLDRALAGSQARFEVLCIRQFFDHPLYIRALAEKIEQGLSGFPERSTVQLFFSAHSLPQSFIDDGYPYLAHIQETVRLVMARLGNVDYHLAFQSRAGPVKWLEPSTEEMMKKLAAEGRKEMLMVPLSFVSDHIESLYEVDIQYAEEAKELGIETFRRSPSLNSSPLFIDCLAELVKSVKE